MMNLSSLFSLSIRYSIKEINKNFDYLSLVNRIVYVPTKNSAPIWCHEIKSS